MSELFLRNHISSGDGKQSNRNETPVKSNINCEKYTIYNYMTKQKSFLKKSKKINNHAPSCKRR